MDAAHDLQKSPDASAIGTTSNELVKLVRKLRWIGMEDEAERLLDELARRRGAAEDDSVFATPGETD